MVLAGVVLAGFEVVVRDAEALGDEGDSRERTASSVAASAIAPMQVTATQVKRLCIPLSYGGWHVKRPAIEAGTLAERRQGLA
jgi:hypothetical protein